MLTFNFFGKVDDGLLSLTLVLEEIDPSISLIVINNHQTIFLPTKTCMRGRTKKIHMKELQNPLGRNDSLA
jgi:hypothetical protein